MAKTGTDWGAVFSGVVASVATISVAAMAVDWLKAKDFWPKPKTMTAGSDYVGGSDNIVNAAKDL